MLSIVWFLIEKSIFIMILMAVFLLIRKVFEGRFSHQSLRFLWIVLICVCIIPIRISVSVPVLSGKYYFAQQNFLSSPYVGFDFSIKAFYKTWAFWALVAWLIGVLAFCGILLAEWIGLKRIVKSGKKKTDGTVEVEGLSSACSFGIIRPCILIPKNVDAKSREIIRKHERIHVKRKDPLLLALFTGIRVVYWFNPILWFTSRALKDDIEYCCDQEATEGMREEERQAYVNCLITETSKECFTDNKICFSNGVLINRIRNIVRPKRYKQHRVVCAIICITMVMLGLFQWNINSQYNNGITENIWVMGSDQNGAGLYSMRLDTGEYQGYYLADSKWYSVKGCVDNQELLSAYKNLDYNKLVERFSLVDFINVTGNISPSVEDAEIRLKEVLENL